MKHLKNFLTGIIFLFVGLQPSDGQTIRFEFQAQKGKTLYLIANKGLQRDTVFSGAIDEKGDLLFTPLKEKPMASGVLSLFIQPDITFDFIYSTTENMTLRCEGEYRYAQNYQILHSPENDFIKTHFPEQMQLREKRLFCEQGLLLYKEKGDLNKELKKEQENRNRQQTAFDTMLQDSSQLYSARLMQIQNVLSDYLSRLKINIDTAEQANIRKQTLARINTETLFYSGFWFPVLNGMLNLYYENSPFFGQFGNDIVRLLQKTESQEVFLALADNAATICNQFGWNADEEALSKYLLLSGRVTNPQGKLKQMLTLNKLQPGMPAPQIIGRDGKTIRWDAEKKTLVVFYESGCNNCENEMNQLIGNYTMLKDKNMDVVSISSDFDQTIFENTSKNYPWPQKLCDLQGFAGINFINYAIIGTPTMYLIDNNGIILGKYARLIDVLNSFK